METENNMIVETLLELSDASDEHMEEVLSDIPIFTERDMLSEWDGLPVKSKLPPEVEAGFKTRSQWEEQNLYPKDDARPVRMHPSPRAQRTFDYYHVSDTGTVTAQAEDEEKQVRVTLCVHPDVKRNLQRQADELDMSVSDYITLLVTHLYDDECGEMD